jgi:D-glycero-D-manno-heptose 1,7-bisphosphate phosphatase
MTRARGVILDRDGTLIDMVRDEEGGFLTPAFHPAQLRLLPGVVDGLQLLRDAGFLFALATNQPGPAKGQYSLAAMTRTNAALVELLAAQGVTLSAVEACTHHPEGGPGGDPRLIGPCDCRKPQPGMLLSAMARTGLAPGDTWMVGDSSADLGAGRAAGVRVGLLFTTRDRCDLCPLRGGPPGSPDLVAARFDDLARAIIAAD